MTGNLTPEANTHINKHTIKEKEGQSDTQRQNQITQPETQKCEYTIPFFSLISELSYISLFVQI